MSNSLPEDLTALLVNFLYDEGWTKVPSSGQAWTHPTKLTDGDPYQDPGYYRLSLEEVAAGYDLDLFSPDIDIKFFRFYIKQLLHRLAK